MKKLALIIVCYNSQSLIKDCLDSVYQYNNIGDELEIIIVDNQSLDQIELFKLIRENYPADIKLIPSEDNGGYGRGNNLGVSHSEAPFLLVMNPDIRLIQPVFREIIQYFESDKQLAMGGVTFHDGSPPFYFKPEYINVWNLIRFKSLIKKGKFNMRRMSLSGSFLAFRAETFQMVQGFDEQIFLYYEEADISNRMLKVGSRIKWMKELEVLHLTHDRPLSLQAIRADLVSLRYYTQKYGLDTASVLTRYKRVYQIKYFVAWLIRNKDKKAFFIAWINLINEMLYRGNFKG